ncbi:30S ribosomal protein S8e [archaeon]|jgi:small subunit ribosomal protein S8e|nr:30S ribosomal protein S8e [archaeon]MBT6761789.1 30S ribosomal protein S8e [archaeon]
MATSQRRAKRKSTGGRYWDDRTKRKKELSRFAANTKISTETRTKSVRACGGTVKRVLLAGDQVNVMGKDGKAQKTTIVNVVENAANPHLVRRNILTKGAVVETKLGKAKITSRPGQEGCMNAVLV